MFKELYTEQTELLMIRNFNNGIDYGGREFKIKPKNINYKNTLESIEKTALS